MSVIFKRGMVQDSSNNNIPDLHAAQRNLAVCEPCGCDDKLGYWTQFDISDGTLMIVVINAGTLEVYPHDALHLTWLRDACAAREAGDSIPDPPQVV